MTAKPLLVFLAIFLAVAGGALAQIQSISSYGSGIGLGPTTTIVPTGNGYTYTSMGGAAGPSWGGVIVSPGTAVQAAITPAGIVTPIVSAAPPPSAMAIPAPTPDPALVSAQIAAANAQQFAADVQALASIESLPPPPARVGVKRAIPVARPDPINQEFVSLFQKLGTKERRQQFWRDFQADFPAGFLTNFPTLSALPYLKLWLRDHSIR